MRRMQSAGSGRVRLEVDLTPVRSRSSATLVADSLRRLIALGGLSPGEKLPSERQLAETLHVGRDSIRAAIRTLGAEALVETRLGRHGGTFVTDRSVHGQRLSDEIFASHRDIAASYEFRAHDRAGGGAACRSARPRRRRIRNILAIAEEAAWSVRSWRAVDSRFHLAIAEASGNPFFVDAVYRTRTALFGWYDSIYSRVPWETLPIQDRDIGYFHRPIAEAISRRDPEARRQPHERRPGMVRARPHRPAGQLRGRVDSQPRASRVVGRRSRTSLGRPRRCRASRPPDSRLQSPYSARARIPGRLRARWAHDATRLGSIPGWYDAFGKNEMKYIHWSIQA